MDRHVRPHRTTHRIAILLALVAVLGSVLPRVEADDGAFRLNRAASLPDWLSISGAQRTRYAAVRGQFRPNLDRNDQAVSLRTNLRFDAGGDVLGAVVEVMDSRVYAADRNSPLSASEVNALDILQAFIRLDGKDLFGQEGQTRLRLGRFTRNVGKRRFMSRNGFRNTINGFTGAHVEWQNKEGARIQAFATLPVRRKPSDLDALLDNRIKLDSQDLATLFTGVHGHLPLDTALLPSGSILEPYIYGLFEDDGENRATADRSLVTPGFRLFRPHRKGAWDYELQAAWQRGTSRASSAPTDRQDLDHKAAFYHGEVGYTFPVAAGLRLSVFYDWASGDKTPGDETNNRFDTLFGSRGFDFGNTGIFGAFSRANLSTPGVMTEIQTESGVSARLRYRPFWLASGTDAWTAAGLRDRTGASGRFAGHQLDGRVRWWLLPGTVRLEAGFTHLTEGRFRQSVPGGPDTGASSFIYTQTLFQF